MIDRQNYKEYLIWLIVLYGLIMTLSDLGYNSVFFDEALNIMVGRQVIAGEFCSACLYFMGSVVVHPILAAAGDAIGGLYGARIISLIFGLGIVGILFAMGRVLYNLKIGLIAATLFLFTGTAQYLMKLATYDTIAAFCLCTGALMIFIAEKSETDKRRMIAMVLGAFFLFVASITKYVLPVFIPFLILYSFFRIGKKETVLYNLVPFLILYTIFVLFFPYSPKGEVLEHLSSAETTVRVEFTTLANWTFRWVALAYLLSVFGMFHEKKGKTALLLFVLSTPIIILHFVTRVEQSVNKNVIYSLVFLAPATALGVDHIGNLFSMRSNSKVTKNFFTIAVIVVSWAYGIYNLNWLEKQYPDNRKVIEFLENRGFDGMVVATNGWSGVMYRYALGDRFPEAQFLQLRDAVEKDGLGRFKYGEIDFIVCEDPYYGDRCPCEDFDYLIEAEYQQLRVFEFEHPWGINQGYVFGRR